MKLKVTPSVSKRFVKSWVEVGKDLHCMVKIHQYPKNSEHARMRQSYRWEIVRKTVDVEVVMCSGHSSVYKLAVKVSEAKKNEVIVAALAAYDASSHSEMHTIWD